MELFQCALVVPCFNEEAAIDDVVATARAVVPAVWVVDDGSSDRTAQLAQRAGATVIRHPVNRGKGAALRTGLTALHSAGFHWALTMDGDGQHDPADIPLFVRAAANGGDLIIGNRVGQPMTKVRALTNRWMSARISQRAGLNCPDSQCGFRMIRLSAWQRLPLRTERFEVESEMLVAFARAGFNIQFVPVHHQPHRRPSRIKPLPDTIRWLAWWLNGRSDLALLSPSHESFR